MARRPAFREEIQLVARSGCTGERVYLIELAGFLGVSRADIAKFAKRMGLFHGKALYRDLPWVTPYGAKRLIAYARAYQQDRLERGLRWLQRRESDARYKARTRAKAKSLAISSAGTDAEHPAAAKT